MIRDRMVGGQTSFLASTSESGRITVTPYDTPEQRKEAGIRRVMDNAGNDWKRYALQQVKALLTEREEITADDIREVVLIDPHKDKAWGGLTSSLLKRGWIVPADKRPRPSRRPEANGHPNPVYTSQLYRRAA